MPDKAKIIEDGSGRATWSNLENAVNAAANVACLLTAAPRYPRCDERDEAAAYAAHQLDERVQQTNRALAMAVASAQACPRANPSSWSDEISGPVRFFSFQWHSLRSKSLAADVRRLDATRTAAG